MTNVVALNFFYDVPVKLYSSHLLLMAVFLLLPDVQRLLGGLLFNRPTEARTLDMPFSFSRRERWGLLALMTLFLVTVVGVFYEELTLLRHFPRKPNRSVPREMS